MLQANKDQKKVFVFFFSTSKYNPSVKWLKKNITQRRKEKENVRFAEIQLALG